MSALLDCSSIPGYFPPPHGLADVRQVYGAIRLVGPDGLRRGGYLVPEAWESEHMAMVHDLPGWGPHALYVNKAIVPMLREALAECAAIGGYEIKQLGAFSPRLKRSNAADLSLHSWGVAVDLNADENPAVRACPPGDPRRTKTIPDAWVAVFKGVGFTWGGDFGAYWDPMHFQWASGY